MKNILKALTGVLAGCMAAGAVALAAGPAAVMETYTGETDLSVYVRGIDIGAEDVNVQIATTEAHQVTAQSVTELDMSMQTLVMLDNSLSIPTEDREKIAEFLQNLIADRMEGEEICIAVFSESVQKITEYTDDYTTLKKAVDGIVYQDQETYLTDALYDLLTEEYIQDPADVYRRIVVVSDGVDNKSLGYTKDELYSLLKDNRIPIYTVGCVNGKNNEELENMFALSRTTSVPYFLMEEVNDILDITDALHQDRDIVKLTVVPSAELLDGSKKSMKITFPDGTVLTDEVTMPQQVYTVEEAAPAVEEEAPKKIPEDLPEDLPEEEPVLPEDDTDTDSYPFLIGGAVAAVLIVAVIVLLVRKRRKKNAVNFEPVGDDILKELERNAAGPDEKTEMVHLFDGQEDDNDATVMIWNQGASYQLVLTDVNSPAKSFQTPLERSVIIGRKKGLCDIVLDYEKSVSGRHCEITVSGGRFYVKDLQSSNGTYLNDSKVLTETEIYSGNVLKLGRLEMRFEVR